MNRTTTVTARVVSYVLQPILIPTFGIIMLLTGDAALSILPAAYRISIAAAIFITTGVVPALIVLLGMMTGNVSAMGGLAGGIIAWSILSGTDPLWLICLTILLGGIVGWSRILLKAHTSAQYCCGWLLGFISVATSWLLV